MQRDTKPGGCGLHPEARQERLESWAEQPYQVDEMDKDKKGVEMDEGSDCKQPSHITYYPLIISPCLSPISHNLLIKIKQNSSEDLDTDPGERLQEERQRVGSMNIFVMQLSKALDAGEWKI
ncbi:hypothetical protein PG994_010025 [Apiospora phragmitis]|uniref:Uncharacterized protein n=1 Tax=Apiospora phragmitis TaxID=2905665 RepID=A0ABR1TNQ4_9PEZI